VRPPARRALLATMFDTLGGKLQDVFRTLRGQGSLTEADVDQALRQIRLALLEADVHFKVVKQFLDRVRVRATGQELLRGLNPAQGVIRVVRDEMVELLGGEAPPRLSTASRLPSVLLMTGLQGSGKTTSSAKLARWLTRNGSHPLLVSTDVQRPAAREQLATLGRQSDLKVHYPAGVDGTRAILRSAIDEARAIGHDFLIVDTAGRLHIDDELMADLAALKADAQPTEVLYVADAMTGQDAVKSATEFHRRIGITGIVLTKLDGDARGGAALSAASVTGCPVKFAGVGERVDEFEIFNPGRMVGRILGMGDVLGLIEKAEEFADADQAAEMVRKIRRNEFTLADYRDQLAQMKKMGPLDQVLSMIPGLGQAAKDVDTAAGESEMRRAMAMIDSMTAAERREPALLNGSRRKRIAKGSGTRVEDVNRLLKQYVQARKMMKQFSGGGGKAMKRLAARMPQMRGQ
jgi:signal recognition particle subunit SRP54